MAKISEFLKDKNISYYRLAQDMGYNPRYYCGILKRSLTGKRSISDEDLNKIVKFLGINKNAVDKTAIRWMID